MKNYHQTRLIYSFILVAFFLAPAAYAQCVSPSKLRYSRTAGESVGTLKWNGPRALYRVYRNNKIVGQTYSRRMSIAVKPGRRYRFIVKNLRSACAKKKVIRMAFYPPKTPPNVAATEVTESQARLSWGKAKPGDGKLAGYRLYRDGKIVRQLRKRSVRVNLSSKRQYEFLVRSVDTRGNQSAPSKTVTIVTGHDRPTKPASLAATTVSESQIRLKWKASRASGGRIVGYRVYRDDTLVQQVSDTDYVVSNLFASRTYTFQVEAVDSFSYVSAKSNAVQAATTPPTPTQGHITAFLLATTDNSFEDLQAHYRQIGTVQPTYFECNLQTAAIQGKDDPLVTQWSKARKIKVLPRVDCQNGAILHTLLTDPGARAAALDRLTALVQEHDYDGLNIDFEAGFETDRDALTSFATELANRLHGMGKLLTICVSAKASDQGFSARGRFYDYRALGQVTDGVFVMNWGQHWSTSVPGPMAHLDWARGVADYTATMPNKHKYTLAAPMYGMDWPNGGGLSNRGTPLEYADIQALLARTGVTPTYDEAAGEWHFTYIEPNGTSHEVWYYDARSLAARIELARSRGLGMGVWRLGREDPNIWNHPAIAPGIMWP